MSLLSYSYRGKPRTAQAQKTHDAVVLGNLLLREGISVLRVGKEVHPQTFTVVPSETARVARAAFPQGNLYMHMRDELGAIYEDVAFASLRPPRP